MLLRTNATEAEIIRTALSEYSRCLRDRARAFCTGYSETGIDLCVRRIEVDDLLRKLEAPQAERTLHVAASNGPERQAPPQVFRQAA